MNSTLNFIHEHFLPTLLGIMCVVLLIALQPHLNRRKRKQFIDAYRFQPQHYAELRRQYTHLTDTHAELLAAGLKTFFQAHLSAPKHLFAMPSRAVDALWHVFILDTKTYHAFCQRAFGRYFHHAPTLSEGEKTAALERMWRFACGASKQSPVMPKHLPQLFVLDTVLDIPNGFKYRIEPLVYLSQLENARLANMRSNDGGLDGVSVDGCDSDCGGDGCGGD